MLNSQISNNFRLELTRNLYLGDKVVLGGNNTKIIDDTNENSNSSTILFKNIFVGSNSIIKNGVRLKKDIMIGANTLVEENILLSGKYFSKFLDKL